MGEYVVETPAILFEHVMLLELFIQGNIFILIIFYHNLAQASIPDIILFD